MLLIGLWIKNAFLATLEVVTIAFLLFLVLLISANFIFPHTISEEKSVISSQQVIVVSNETFLNHQQDLLLTNDSYYVLPSVNVGFGRSPESGVKWHWICGLHFLTRAI